MFDWLNKKFPQNYIIANPYKGALTIALFSFLFLILYRPLKTHETGGLSYAGTMAIYIVIMAVSFITVVKLLKIFSFFSGKHSWTFSREIIVIVLILTAIGIVIYFTAFVVEPPAERWNFRTFFDSMLHAFLIGILPFAFFTLSNLNHLFTKKNLPARDRFTSGSFENAGEERIIINSSLKKERLEFFPSQFLFAEADGNYIAFHLLYDEGLKKAVIRNSISEIEKQMSEVSFFFRTHRAFIVNLKKVVDKQGNSSGYNLKLRGTTVQIPVSRQNIKAFEKMMDRI